MERQTRYGRPSLKPPQSSLFASLAVYSLNKETSPIPGGVSTCPSGQEHHHRRREFSEPSSDAGNRFRYPMDAPGFPMFLSRENPHLSFEQLVVKCQYENIRSVLERLSFCSSCLSYLEQLCSRRFNGRTLAFLVYSGLAIYWFVSPGLFLIS